MFLLPKPLPYVKIKLIIRNIFLFFYSSVEVSLLVIDLSPLKQYRMKIRIKFILVIFSTKFQKRLELAQSKTLVKFFWSYFKVCQKLLLYLFRINLFYVSCNNSNLGVSTFLNFVAKFAEKIVSTKKFNILAIKTKVIFFYKGKETIFGIFFFYLL